MFSAIFIKPPYETEKHDASDPLYKHFYTKNFQTFWKEQQFAEIIDFINKNFPNSRMDDLKDLLQKMLNPDKNQRITISQVLSHPWFKNWMIGLQQVAASTAFQKQQTNILSWTMIIPTIS